MTSFEQMNAQAAGRFLLRYLGPQRGRALGMSALLLAGIALQLANPQVIRHFLDTAQSGGAPRALLLAALLFIAFALLQRAADLAAAILSQTVGWGATNRLRSDLLRHILALDMTFHKQHTPGELIERIDGDVGQLANFFSQFAVRVAANGLLLLGILAMLFRENVWLGLGMLLYSAASLLVLNLIQKLAVSRWAAERQASAEQYGYIEERIAGAEDIRAVGAEQDALHGLYRRMRAYLRAARAAWVTGSLTYNLTNLVHAVGYTIGLAAGVALYLRGQVTLGTVYLLTYYIGMLHEPLQAIRAQAQDFQLAAASLGRIQQLLRLQPAVRDAPAAAALPLPEGALALSVEDVSFHYEQDDDVLRGIRFELDAGRVLGVLGRTGSGKTTLSRLLFRLYDPAAGSIRLGGVDLRRVPQAELRRRVALVTQDVQLFQAALRDNLTFFNPAVSDARLEDALRGLGLWEWAAGLPGGLGAQLAGGNQGLSAGEAQLLAFARVFLKDPGLVILDEASSRLDPATEALLERAVERLLSGRSAVIIAHRLRTLERADDILILEEGRVVEFGPRRALAADPASRYAAYLRAGLEEVLQ